MPADALDRLVRQVQTQVRWRRAEYWALRGAFWSALLAVVPLAIKGPLGHLAVPVAVALVGTGLVAGLCYGFTRRVAPADAARLADRAFGLADRIGTALEYVGRTDAGPMAAALIADTLARVERLEPRQIVRRTLPREARALPIPVVAALVLAVAPPVPMPATRFFDVSPTPGTEETPEHAEGTMMEDTPRATPRDPMRRPLLEERDFSERSGTAAPSTPGDLSAIFKDTSLANQRPDFNSFLKKGDDRLKLLEQVDRLPDLQSDFTSSDYKMVFRKSKELRSGLRPDQISPQKLKELLDEMQRLGKKGGNWSGDAAEGMDALESGQQDKAMQAMENALNKMRSFDEREHAGKSLRGGRDAAGGGGQSRDRSKNGGAGSPDDEDFGQGEGLLPGKGKSQSPKGEASQRLKASPYDVGVEGESRKGRKDAYSTNMTGRGGKMDSRLQYLGVIGQYRKMMEDDIAREQVPRDFRAQVKDYFQALDER